MPHTGRQIGRFLCVGGSSVAVDLVCYWLLLSSFTPMPAKGISYLIGMAVGFIGNKLWTFESKQRSLSEPALYSLVYAVSLAVNIGLNSGVLALLNPVIDLPSINRAAAFLIATGTTTVLNFVGLKFIAFRRSHQSVEIANA
ncbi:MAG: GtrA family protein [Pirellulales bacterium]